MLKAVQELCRSFYGVTAVTAESYGCVWHFQQRYAGHDVLEVSLEWTYGAITFLTGDRTLIENPSMVVDAQSRA